MNKDKFEAQMSEMLVMQDAVNSAIDPDWRDKQYPWYRAIWVECAELMDHYGWKWWKKQEPDMGQVKLELVDIWHFMLSFRLQCPAEETTIGRLKDEVEYSFEKKPAGSFLCDAEEFIADLLVTRRPSTAQFFLMCSHIGFDFEELYRLYIGKNVLNVFRQKFGYKEGTYQKVWGGKEDNVWLMEIVGELGQDAEDFAQHVEFRLAQEYIRNNDA